MPNSKHTILLHCRWCLPSHRLVRWSLQTPSQQPSNIHQRPDTVEKDGFESKKGNWCFVCQASRTRGKARTDYRLMRLVAGMESIIWGALLEIDFPRDGPGLFPFPKSMNLERVCPNQTHQWGSNSGRKVGKVVSSSF